MAARQSKAEAAAREHAKWTKRGPQLYKMAQSQVRARRQREIEIAGKKSRAIFEHMLSEGTWPPARPSLVDQFRTLDHRLHWATHHPEAVPMSDEEFDKLAEDRAAAAMRVIAEPAIDREAIAAKLDVIARVLRTLDGDVGKAELGMVRQLVVDVERLISKDDEADEQSAPAA
jgi:hypothetical protein